MSGRRAGAAVLVVVALGGCGGPAPRSVETAVAQVEAAVAEIGGADAQIIAIPILFQDPTTGEFSRVTLFRVDPADGRPSGYVDATGARYDSVADFRRHNDLRGGGPVGPGPG